MQRLIKRLAAFRGRVTAGISGGVVRGTLVLLAGSGAARVVGLAAMPILTRIYTPESFGVLAIFTALLAILAPLVTLRYTQALPLPRHDGMAMNLLALSTLLMLVLSLLVAALLWIWGPKTLGLISMEALAPWWWIVAIGVLMTAIYEILTMWATRERGYKAIAVTQIWQSAIGTVVKIALGLFGLQPGGLLVGQVFTQCGGSGSLLRSFGTKFRQSLRHVNLSRMQKVAWRYRGFPAYRVPSQFLLILSQQAPLIYLSYAFGAAVTGQFSLALMSLSLPLNLLGGAAGKALYAEAARENSSSRIVQMAQQTQWRLFLLGIIPALILMFGGKYIFILVFGDIWGDAGRYAQILSPMLLFQFSSSPLVQLLNIAPRQIFFLAINLMRVVLLAICFIVVSALDAGSDQFVIIYSLVMSLFYVSMSFMVIREIGSSERK